jgi:hypothetical protein
MPAEVSAENSRSTNLPHQHTSKRNPYPPREPASPACLQATQDRADEALGRRAERGRQWDQLFDRHPTLAVLASLDGHQVPTETFGQGFLRQAGALPQLVQRRGDGAMFGLELLGDAASHAAMFKGRAPSQQNVVIAETVRVYSPEAGPAPQPAGNR